MQQLIQTVTRPSRRRGFTVVELMIALTITGVLMALGVPLMTDWLTANRARSASEFYGDGFVTARRQAIMHNARSRIVMSPNNENDQLDWTVDICFPRPNVPCNSASGVWSTTTTVAPGDPELLKGYKSIHRSASSLPKSEILTPSIKPAGSTGVYFTELGWVDTSDNARLTEMRFDPAPRFKDEVPVVAIRVSLAGMASKCDPTKSGTDSRACPP